MDRRRFLKYAGVTGTVVGASALGLDYVLSSRLSPANQTTTSLSQTTSSSTTNHPPRFLWPPLNMKPKYVLPTPQYTIELSPNATDDDNDPLSFTWSVDGKEVSHENSYSTKLTEGDHEIGLRASDGRTSAFSKNTLAVEPDQIYPVKPLHLKYKGVRYYAGSVTPDWQGIPNPSDEEMDEQLDTIHYELGCNALIISGGEISEDRIIHCALMAIDKGFERIYVEPCYNNSTVDETIDKIGKFAPKVKSLRERSLAIVYMIGHEFQLETAIASGATQMERWKTQLASPQAWNTMRTVLPQMFKRIIQVCNSEYGYPITCAATPPEASDGLVPWSDPAFESVGVDAYITDAYGWDERWWVSMLSYLKRFRKPIIVPDFGMETYAGADKYGGDNPLYMDDKPYDEEPQARYIVREVNMFHRASIDGCFWVRYNHEYDKEHGLYNPYTRKRKKGFYMYKSYQRSP